LQVHSAPFIEAVATMITCHAPTAENRTHLRQVAEASVVYEREFYDTLVDRMLQALPSVRHWGRDKSFCDPPQRSIPKHPRCMPVCRIWVASSQAHRSTALQRLTFEANVR
jgi:hypothetical protein